MELPEDPEEEGEHQVHHFLAAVEQTIQDQHNKVFLAVREALLIILPEAVGAPPASEEMQHQLNLVQAAQDTLLQ